MTSPTTTDDKPQTSLVKHLLGLASRDDRGPLAELRREASSWPACGAGALRHVARFFPEGDRDWHNERREDALLLLATLFALNPSTSDSGGDMGAVMRATGERRGGPEAVEARFLRLLGAREPEELANHLRHAVQLAASSGVAVGWSQLERDLVSLLSGDEDRRQRVLRKWSRSFWSKSDHDAETES